MVLVVAGRRARGKTTEAARFLEGRAGRTAWLSVDASDRASGRFVSYLAAAVGTVEPALETMVQELLADGMLAEDCAALLAERLGQGWTIVIDDLHHLEPDAQALGPCGPSCAGSPPDALTVLVSRRIPNLDLSSELLRGSLSGVFDAELAFDLDETHALLEARQVARRRRGRLEGDGRVGRRHRVRGAPAAGGGGGPPAGRGPALLLPRRRDPRGPAGPDPARPAPDGRARHGDAAAARAAAPARSRRCCSTSSPACTCPPPPSPGSCATTRSSASSSSTGCTREMPGEVPGLLRAYGRQLAAEGFREEAVDVLLQAGRSDEAEELAETVVTDLRRRGDWGKILAWTEALGEGAVRRRPALREVQVRALLNSRRQEELEDLVHEMLAEGEMGELVESSPDVAAWAVWALHGSGEWAKLVPLLPPRGRSRVGEVMRYMLVSTVARDAPEDLAESALGRMHPLHVVLQEALYFQGRFDAASRLAAVAATSGGPVTAAVAQVHKVNVLRARGETGPRARVLESVPASIRTSRFIEFWLHAEAELCLEEGSGERALELIRAARGVSARHGWRVGDSAIFGAVEGRMLVRLGMPERAIEVLGEVRDWCAQRGLASFREWAETWLGGALLLLDRPAEEARALLEPAVNAMRRARRHLELPAAAVFLAEAEWRHGRRGRPRRGGRGRLRGGRAVRDPAPPDDRPRAGPGRARAAARLRGPRRASGGGARSCPWSSTETVAPETEGARLRVRTLGPPLLELDGEPLANVPLKAVELAAEIARSGPPGVPRNQLIAALFEGSRDGPNYLRQLVFRLRRVLPGRPRAAVLRAPAGVEAGRAAWPPTTPCSNRSTARARTEVGPARDETLAVALELAERGRTWRASTTRASSSGGASLGGVAMDVRLEFARAMRAAGRPGEAVAALQAAIDADPYREDAWQELMRIHARLEGPASVARVFLECRRSLSEVDLEPSGETFHAAGAPARLSAARPSVRRADNAASRAGPARGAAASNARRA